MPPQAVSQITTVPHNSAKAASYSPPAVQSNRNSPTAANVVTDIGHIRGTILMHTQPAICASQNGVKRRCARPLKDAKCIQERQGFFLRAGFLLLNRKYYYLCR